MTIFIFIKIQKYVCYYLKFNLSCFYKIKNKFYSHINYKILYQYSIQILFIQFFINKNKNQKKIIQYNYIQTYEKKNRQKVCMKIDFVIKTTIFSFQPSMNADR